MDSAVIVDPGVDATPAGTGRDRREAVAVAGHRGDEPGARAHLVDPDPSVRATALSALVRMGRAGPDDVLAGLHDPTPTVRRRAARAAGEAAAAGAGVTGAGGAAPSGGAGTGARGTGAPSPVDAALVRALADPDALVVDAACWAIGERGGGGDPDAVTAALSAVATGHADARCREAAVAALGALGALGLTGGRATVLLALGDRPPVRRRAAVALAAFGPAGEEALRGCLQDRDWQVRQVAETLLGE